MQTINSQTRIQRLSDIAKLGILSQHYNEVSISETDNNVVFSIPKEFLNIKVEKIKETPKNTLSPFEKMFGFMDKDMEIPNDFDEMCADEIEQLFAGKESSDEYLI